MERKFLDFERRSRRHTSSERKDDKFMFLQRKLDKLEGDHKRMKESFQNTLRTKERECNVLKNLCKEQKVVYDQAITQLHKIGSPNSKDNDIEASSDNKLKIRELNEENSFLREQLMDMKERYLEIIADRK